MRKRVLTAGIWGVMMMLTPVFGFQTSVRAQYFVGSGGDCGNETPCYSKIQDAVDAAPDRSEILVRQGTYEESISLTSAKTVTVKGGYDSAYSGQTANTTFIQGIGQTTIQATGGSLKFQMLSILPVGAPPPWTNSLVWKALSVVSSPALSHHSMVTLDNELYMYASQEYASQEGATAIRGELLNKLWSYNSETGWTEISTYNPPPARENHGAVALKGKMYVLFGEDENGKNLDDFWEYDPATKSWTKKELSGVTPKHRTDMSFAPDVYNIYISGGQDESGAATADVFSCTPETGVVSQVASCESDLARYGHGSFMKDGKLYLVFGSDGSSDRRDMVAVDPDNHTCSTVTVQGTAPDARKDSVILVDGDWVHFFGGSKNNEATREVWSYNLSENRWQQQEDMPADPYGAVGSYTDENGYKQIIYHGGKNDDGSDSNKMWKIWKEDQLQRYIAIPPELTLKYQSMSMKIHYVEYYPGDYNEDGTPNYRTDINVVDKCTYGAVPQGYVSLKTETLNYSGEDESYLTLTKLQNVNAEVVVHVDCSNANLPTGVETQYAISVHLEAQ